MTAIDRTAYPRPGSRLTHEELRARYTLTETDLIFVRLGARGEIGRLTLATLLKARHDLGCFPAMGEIHADTMGHLAQQLGLTASVLPAVTHKTKSLYRYQAAVRSYLSVTHYEDIAEGLVTKTILATAETMSDPADLINQAVETLQAASIDLPAFSTLDRLVNRLRTEVHTRIYNRVLARVTPEHLVILDALLVKPANSTTTSFNRLKQTPGPATPMTIRLWIERLDWLAGLINPDPLLEGVAHTKLRQFAAEAAALEVSELLDISQPGKRHTLLLALLRQARMRCRDELVEMMLRRVRRTQAAAKEQLEALHDQQRETEEALIGVFGQVLQTAQAQEAETTKIETYNEFLDWVCFGGPVVKSGDPVEQEKQLKYASLVANTVMLSNVADLTEVLGAMATDRHPVTADLVASISPYLREHIRRFGKFSLDMANLPKPLNPQPLPFEVAL